MEAVVTNRSRWALVLRRKRGASRSAGVGAALNSSSRGTNDGRVRAAAVVGGRSE
jgi:hypothetical protein